jgi:threonylcarbamoyladenosine tRNA methylthiotransferase MtaB
VSVEAITLGCRLNFAESEAMKALALPNTTIVNSCAVTSEAVRQTRQAIRRARRDRPEARIVVAGCAAQLDPAAFRAMPEVDEVQVRDFTRPPTIAAGFRQRVRSFVAVQTGCDHRCTFCTIWQARGPSVSLPFAAVRDAVARELDAGAAEIVLTGVDLTAVEGGLGRLCERLLAHLPQLQRLRLSSLDSMEVDDALLTLIAGEERLMPHFHLSLQSGDDLILKRMKRRHLARDAAALVARIKQARPDATIGADLIAGFPTESEAAAANTRRLLHECDVIAAHVFPFSPRPNTPAARMPQVDPVVIKARAARLREAAAARRSAWLEGLVGTRLPVLVENKEKGHSDGFAPVWIEGSARGQTGVTTIVGRLPDHLIGKFTRGLA